MSDKPLFQDADEQEATYAPQQTSEVADQEAPQDGMPLIVPAAGAVGPGITGTPGAGAGSIAAGAPAVGAAELETEMDNETTDPARATSPGTVSDTDDTH